jgi:hypothetical protein
MTPAMPKDALLAAPVYPGEIGLVLDGLDGGGGVYTPVPVGAGACVVTLLDG